MNVHKNAKLTATGRAELVRRVIEAGQAPKAVATAFGIDPKTVSKWVARFLADGPSGLEDRSSRPHLMPTATPAGDTERIVALRRQRLTGRRISRDVGVSPATVSRVLRRAGLSRIRDLEPAPPVVRYEREHPGELIHIDIKKLGRFEKIGPRITGERSSRSKSRGAGWEYVHVCVDDASRLAFSQVLPNQTAVSAIAFLQAAVAYYTTLGVQVRAVMTDNGPCYYAKIFRKACQQLGLKHIRTRPYRPQTNGKAERFIQTALREWAYARAYTSSDQRTDHLPGWLHSYNWHRPHGGIGSNTPISRLALDADNLLTIHT
jgi:transposase InsO family protein